MCVASTFCHCKILSCISCNCWLMSLLTSHCHANATAHLEPSWANKLLLFLIPFHRLLLSLQWRLPISLICNCAEILEPWKWHANWNTNSVDVLLPKGCIKSAKLYITGDKEIILYFRLWYYLDPYLYNLDKWKGKCNEDVGLHMWNT